MNKKNIHATNTHLQRSKSNTVMNKKYSKYQQREAVISNKLAQTLSHTAKPFPKQTTHTIIPKFLNTKNHRSSHSNKKMHNKINLIKPATSVMHSKLPRKTIRKNLEHEIETRGRKISYFFGRKIKIKG